MNEENFGDTTGKESLLYYDLDQHGFFKTQRPEPAPEPEFDAAAEEPPAPGPAPEQKYIPFTIPLPPLNQGTAGPEFFIDLTPSHPTDTPRPLPNKGILENDSP